jgi:hypothetical protein
MSQQTLRDFSEDLDVFGDVPLPRFGHTITVVSKSKVILFGGATGDTGRYSMTGDTYCLNLLKRCWNKLNGKCSKILQNPSFALKNDTNNCIL